MATDYFNPFSLISCVFLNPLPDGQCLQERLLTKLHIVFIFIALRCLFKIRNVGNSCLLADNASQNNSLRKICSWTAGDRRRQVKQCLNNIFYR